ncbi:hypothetical protein B0H10DRAFT_1999454 [Mycena sp. CBHHK59/15]|nr:hypothetical protein B0H10DRAFT_1999454 [Mycena sp. CBHHK59/15]
MPSSQRQDTFSPNSSSHDLRAGSLLTWIKANFSERNPGFSIYTTKHVLRTTSLFPMRFIPSILTIALPLAASALKLSPPTNPHSGQVTDILWTVEPHDPPTWTLFLMNISQAFDLKDIVAENVDPAPGKLTHKFPVLKPSNDYVLYAVNATNLDWVLASSGRFTIFA